MRLVLMLAVLLASPTLTGAVQPPPLVDHGQEALKSDLDILEAVKLPTTDDALLTYFKQRTLAEADPKQVATMIDDLGSKKFKVREKAYADLLALGGLVIEALQKAEQHDNPEICRRAADLRHRIEEKVNPTVQAASVRILGARKPAGAAEVLLAYAPFAATEYVVDELCDAVARLAVRDGKPEPALLQAVTDKAPLKRAVAAAALLRANVAGQDKELQPLLKDPDPRVRLRVGMGLVPYKHNAALPAIVDALAHLSPEELQDAEELLLRLGGPKAPDVPLGSDAPSRKLCHQAWAAWWKDVQGGFDLAKIDLAKTQAGFTLVVRQIPNKIVNGMLVQGGQQVLELDRHNKPRWAIDMKTFPMDAQVVGPDRVLVTEQNGMCVTERDFKGNVKWRKAVASNPVSARRLANGNTVIVLRNAVLEYDPAGKEVFALDRPTFDIARAAKLPNGQVAVINYQGLVQYFDPKTKMMVKQHQITAKNFGVRQGGHLEVLPNGNLLVALYSDSRVIEIDGDGATKWQATASLPGTVQRLPDGNTLVVSPNQRVLRLFDREGKEVPNSMQTVEGTGALYTATRR